MTVISKYGQWTPQYRWWRSSCQTIALLWSWWCVAASTFRWKMWLTRLGIFLRWYYQHLEAAGGVVSLPVSREGCEGSEVSTLSPTFVRWTLWTLAVILSWYCSPSGWFLTGLLSKQEHFTLVTRFARSTDPVFKASRSRNYRKCWYFKFLCVHFHR